MTPILIIEKEIYTFDTDSIIYINTTSKFGILDRIRILFGKSIISEIKVYPKCISQSDETKVIAYSKATTIVEHIFPRRTKNTPLTIVQ